MATYFKQETIDQIKSLLEEGHNVTHTARQVGVSHDTVRRIRRYSFEYIPPLEQAIQMLELGYSECEVYAWWGEELLKEALEWIKL